MISEQKAGYILIVTVLAFVSVFLISIKNQITDQTAQIQKLTQENSNYKIQIESLKKQMINK